MNQNRLKELLQYDPDTGIFTWLVSPSMAINIGDVAGSAYPNGYITIRIKGKGFLAHRLAFLYMTGSYPKDQTDHINRKRDDNRWCNLREATQKTNSSNKKNNTDYVGVHWKQRINKWHAQISIMGKKYHIGYYKTHLAACYARHYTELCNE